MSDFSLDWSSGGSPQDFLEELNTALDEAEDELQQAMTDIGAKLEADAKDEAPVDTGRLRSDINHVVERLAMDAARVQVGNNVEYAPYQEFIHNPYLGPALEENIDWIRERLEDAYSEALDK